MTQTKALKLALEAFQWIASQPTTGAIQVRAIAEATAIKEALEQPEQEPVAVMELYTGGWDLVEGIDIDWLETLPFGTKLYTTPPQRTWVGLTWNDIPEEWVGNVAFMEGAKWADRQLKDKNNG